MNYPSKDHVKRALEKSEYRTYEKSTRTTAKWWDNFQRIKDDCYNIVPYFQCIRCRQLLAYDPKSSGTRSINFHAQSCKVVSLNSNRNIERMRMKSPTVSNETKKIFIDACIKFCFSDMRP